MKKMVAILLVLCLCLGLCACMSTQVEPLTIKSVSMDIPTYWDDWSSQSGCLSYYAEKGSTLLSEYRTSGLDVVFYEDANLIASFENLAAKHEAIVQNIESKYDKVNVLSHAPFESNHGVQGVLYKFTFNQDTGLFSSETANGLHFCFASEADQMWFDITIIIVNGADDHDYEADYMEMLASIKYLSAEPTDNTHSSSFPSTDATVESSTATEPTTALTDPTESSAAATEPTEAPTEPSTVATEPSTEATEPPSAVMNKGSSVYVGMDPQAVKQELNQLGFANVKLVPRVTTDKTKPDGTVASVTINSRPFFEGDVIKTSTEIVIVYIQIEKATAEVRLPEQGMKLARDYDITSEYQGTVTVYYMNIDNQKNRPYIAKWNNITIVDSVVEYLNRLEDLGYTITVVSHNHSKPGYDLYETRFKVSLGSFYWTMNLLVQNEAYVEYSLDITYSKS